jgi:hypothetical protein
LKGIGVEKAYHAKKVMGRRPVREEDDLML